MTAPWFDAHLDLASLAETGRNMRLPAEQVTGPFPPAAATLPSLAEGNIRAMLATIFIQRRTTEVNDPITFETEDEAHAAALRQFAHYKQWQDEGLFRIAQNSTELLDATQKTPAAPPAAMILMEGAASVRTPADLHTFHHLGLRVLTLTWGEGTKYSGGNFNAEGISTLGRELVASADALNLIHDVSHLSDEAFWNLTKIAKRPFIASHSNCRALLPNAKCPPRHLSDEQIRAVTSNGGVIGIVLYNYFLTGTANAEISDILRHINHIEKIAGRRDCIGLGSDMDGGFSANQMPANLNHPRQFPNLADALEKSGWSKAEVEGFMFNNWANFFRKHF